MCITNLTTDQFLTRARVLFAVYTRGLKQYSIIDVLAKKILQGTVTEERRTGRQKNRLENNIKGWKEWRLICHVSLVFLDLVCGYLLLFLLDIK